MKLWNKLLSLYWAPPGKKSIQFFGHLVVATCLFTGYGMLKIHFGIMDSMFEFRYEFLTMIGIFISWNIVFMSLAVRKFGDDKDPRA